MFSVLTAESPLPPWRLLAWKDPSHARVLTFAPRLPLRHLLSVPPCLQVIHAQRALSVQELVEALAIEPGATQLNVELCPEPEDLDSLCAGLVVVDHNTEMVRLVHYTAQEYFQQKNPFPGAHTALLAACTAYLSFDTFSAQLAIAGFPMWGLLKPHAFYLYAAGFWSCHAGVSNSIPKSAIAFLKSSSISLQNALEVHRCVVERGSMIPNGVKFGSKMLGVHVAAYYGLNSILDNMIESGQTPDAKDVWAQTPLFYAAFRNHAHTVNYLLHRHGLDPNYARYDRRTPLSLALKNRSLASARTILDHSRTNLKDVHDHAEAPPFGSTKRPYRLLVSNGYDARDGDMGPRDALATAIFWRQKEAVRWILARDESDCTSGNQTGCDISRALMEAFRIGNREIVEALFEKYTGDFQEKAINGRSMLSCAAEGGLVELAMRFLTEHGAEADSKDSEGRTPLCYAMRSYTRMTCNQDMLELLVAHGADPTVVEANAYSPMGFAVGLELVEIVEFFLARSFHASLDSDNRGGLFSLQLALGLAISSVAPSILKLLVSKYGADLEHVDADGHTPLYWAVRYKDRGVASKEIYEYCTAALERGPEHGSSAGSSTNSAG